MSIYQEEMMRKLPKLGCTGTLDEATGTLSIRQNGVFLCQQLVDGILRYWSGKSDRLYLFEAPIDMLSYTPCTRTAGNSTAMPPPAVCRIGCCFKCCVTIRVSKPSAFASTTMTVAETYIQKDR